MRRSCAAAFADAGPRWWRWMRPVQRRCRCWLRRPARFPLRWGTAGAPHGSECGCVSVFGVLLWLINALAPCQVTSRDAHCGTLHSLAPCTACTACTSCKACTPCTACTACTSAQECVTRAQTDTLVQGSKKRRAASPEHPTPATQAPRKRRRAPPTPADSDATDAEDGAAPARTRGRAHATPVVPTERWKVKDAPATATPATATHAPTPRCAYGVCTGDSCSASIHDRRRGGKKASVKKEHRVGDADVPLVEADNDQEAEEEPPVVETTVVLEPLVVRDATVCRVQHTSACRCGKCRPRPARDVHPCMVATLSSFTRRRVRRHGVDGRWRPWTGGGGRWSVMIRSRFCGACGYWCQWMK